MHVLVVPVPGFSHLSLGAIVEPLHVVGEILPGAGIEITLGSITAPEVPSAAGVPVLCTWSLGDCLRSLRSAARPDALVLCCGLRTPYRSQGDIRKLLRTAHLARVPILGTGCAAWKMADAGILQGGAGTVHWTTLPAFAERHHDIEARDALFVAYNDVTSSPGDAAALDMMIGYLSRHLPEPAIRDLCDHLMLGYPRSGSARQPRDRTERLQGAPEGLHRALALMAEHFETPLLVRDIARRVGLSLRQVERLFATHLGTSPKAYYIQLRLQHARLLIEQTSMSILEVSVAAGFSSRRTFTQYYRQAFGFPPAHTRRTP